MDKRVHLGLVLVIALLVGCSPNRPSESADDSTTATPSPSIESSQPPRLDSGGNFVLYVSNQSFDVDPVDISIEIDGVKVVEQSFEVKNQHNWKKFVLALAEGDHTIRAYSTKGPATLTKTFVVKDKHWAVVDFWYSDGESGTPQDHMFTFSIDDEPIRFAGGARSTKGIEPTASQAPYPKSARSRAAAVLRRG